MILCQEKNTLIFFIKFIKS